ncbi:hypothetical protein [Haloarchaeobius sp. DT45]|uniref:hypothetical protein n=1 Tax=Haloarchaeobius sp. DT45 TaxID=3446116 RepID=UPI003F6D63CB
MSDRRTAVVLAIALAVVLSATVAPLGVLSAFGDVEEIGVTFESAAQPDEQPGVVTGYVVVENGQERSDWGGSTIRIADDAGDQVLVEITRSETGVLELRFSRSIPDAVRIYIDAGKLADELGIETAALATSTLEIDGVGQPYQLVTSGGTEYVTFVIDHFSTRAVRIVAPVPESSDGPVFTGSGPTNTTSDEDNTTGDNTTTGADNTTVGDDTIEDNTTVGDNITEDNTTVGDDTTTEDNTTVGDDTATGDNTTVGDDTATGDNATTGADNTTDGDDTTTVQESDVEDGATTGSDNETATENEPNTDDGAPTDSGTDPADDSGNDGPSTGDDTSTTGNTATDEPTTETDDVIDGPSTGTGTGGVSDETTVDGASA